MSSNLPEGHYAELSQDFRWHYLDFPALGESTGTTVVLVHGSGPGASGWSNFQFNVESFQQAGHRVLVPDLPGYGFSSKPTDAIYTLDYFVSYLEEWLDAIDVQRCILIGNSLGGAISIGTALKSPERIEKLILMASGGLEDREVYFAAEGIQEMVKYPMGSPEFTQEVLGKLLTLLVYDAALVTPSLLAQRWQILQQQNPQVLATMQVPNLANQLSELKCPVLGFWGREDKFCPVSGAQVLLEKASQLQLNILSECGHWVMVEYPDYFNRQCLDFIASQ